MEKHVLNDVNNSIPWGRVFFTGQMPVAKILSANPGGSRRAIEVHGMECIGNFRGRRRAIRDCIGTDMEREEVTCRRNTRIKSFEFCSNSGEVFVGWLRWAARTLAIPAFDMAIGTLGILGSKTEFNIVANRVCANTTVTTNMPTDVTRKEAKGGR
jgi:hypothetical protein